MLTAARTALPGTLMLCMCLFCLAYYELCVRRAGPRVSGLWIWPAGGFLFGGASLLSYLCPAWFGRSWDFLLQHPALKSAVLTACAAALLLFLRNVQKRQKRASLYYRARRKSKGKPSQPRAQRTAGYRIFLSARKPRHLCDSLRRARTG